MLFTRLNSVHSLDQIESTFVTHRLEVAASSVQVCLEIWYDILSGRVNNILIVLMLSVKFSIVSVYTNSMYWANNDNESVLPSAHVDYQLRPDNLPNRNSINCERSNWHLILG